MKFDNLIKKVLKEATFGRSEFYHGTDKTNMQSMISGIKPEMAGTNFDGAGAEQGKGFYVFRNKQNSLKYAKSTEFIKDPIIVVIDEELNTNSFDIDYEAEYRLVQPFIAKHIDEFISNPKYDLKQSPLAKQMGIVMIGNGTGGLRKFPLTKPYDSSIDEATQRIMAEYLFSFFERVKTLNPTLYNQFEDEVLNKANVLKYNGERKIFPTRIEDIQGNILWKKDQQ